MAKTETIDVGSVLIDETLYPRHKLSAQNVTYLKEAIRAGTELPPIVIDAKTRKVVDGWHRIRACQSLKIPTIEAELRNYSSQQEMFTAAVSLNASHGYKLTVWDQIRSLLRLLELGASDEVIQQALHITPERMAKLRLRTGTAPDGTAEPLKQSTKQLAGKKLTKAQVEYNRGSAPGRGIASMLQQIIRALEAKAIDVATEEMDQLFRRVIELYEEQAA